MPILKGAVIPIPYDFKEAPFIEVPYMKLPHEFEGYGLPMIMENPQLMLNTIKNQRIDSATLGIHKMWIVNPLANINKDELVTRPFGIIYSVDPNGVRPVEFSDIKQSAYREEDLLKGDMRYASGVDDFSMGAGGAGTTSATEVRHLRESTLERVRLFVNHLGDAYADVLRYWMDMQRQFFTKDMTIRILGDNGKEVFPLIQKDDLMGNFDYQAKVLPSIAGQNDIKKKQDMDLFQLLVTLPFVDPKKLTARILGDFGWSIDSIEQSEQAAGPEEGQPGMPMGPEGAMPPQPGAQPMDVGQGVPPTTAIPPDVLRGALDMMHGGGQEASPFMQAASPINLLQGGMPPTVPGIPAGGKGGPGPGSKTTNLRGHNMGGKVNTNINQNGKSNPESALMNRTFNIQR